MRGKQDYLVPMEMIGLPEDVFNMLKRWGFKSVADCLDLVDVGPGITFTPRPGQLEITPVIRYHLIKRGMLSPDDVPVEMLGLSHNVIATMKRAGIATVGDVLAMLDHEREFPTEPRPGRDELITSITQTLVSNGYLPPDYGRAAED